MLSKEDNELLTRVGPGTPMGSLMREYWMPVVRSAKLVADGAPERVRLLGENFVAFRATDGRVGFIDEACPHRLASMALGRNEGNGLRCIFHGWKVDVEGRLVDTPTEPAERREAFCSRAPHNRYFTREAGGMLWVYIGKKDTPPPFPEFEFNALGDDQVEPLRGIMKCNWLQALEAALDSAHVGFLHARDGGMRGTTRTFAETQYMTVNKAPRFEFDLRPYGFKEGAIRDLPDDAFYARIRQVVLPFYSLIPRLPDEPRLALISVPIDDYNTVQWYVRYFPEGPLKAEYFDLFGTDCGDPDYFNADMGDVSNMWHQDRQAMKDGHWSGIVGRVNAYEDFVVQESMGPLVDRSREYLGASDVIISLARRQLLKAVRDHQAGGAVPFVTDGDSLIDYATIRSLSVKVPAGTAWKELDPFNPPVEEAAE
jgi:phthalate 4,5-dioxygenase oxygenase subunit